MAVTREISERQVYLDADVLRYFMQGVLDPCRPPMERSPAPHPSVARLWVTAVRLVLHAPDHNWHLWISDTGRGELEAFDQQYGWAGWTRSLFEDVDGRPEAPTPEQVAARGRDYLAQLGIGDRHAKDMAHLAWAAMTPWIDTFITNDERLRRRARRLAVQFNDVRQLRIVDPLRAVQELDLQRWRELCSAPCGPADGEVPGQVRGEERPAGSPSRRGHGRDASCASSRRWRPASVWRPCC